MRRGEIWVASFRPWRGREVGKVRPCLIMQADILTGEDFDTVLALPLTSQYWPNTAAMRIELTPRQRLKKRSWVMVEKMRALDRAVFSEGPLAELTQDEMAVIEMRLRVALGMS